MVDQKRTAIDWDDVRIFLAVAREGSLSAAARLLGINHATVSRRLLNLERRSGSAPLLEKTKSGYVLTAAGELAFADARAMEAAADGFRLNAQAGDELSGTVRVSATTTFAEHLLAAMLAEIAAQQPALAVDLSADDRNVSLSRGEADIAVRLGRPLSGDALARSIGSVDYHLYATAEYLNFTPPLQRRLIGYSETVSPLAPGVRRLEALGAGSPFALRCPTLGAQARAAAAGSGMALLPLFLAVADPRLNRVDPAAEPAWNHPIWLVVRKDVRRVRRVRFVADALAAALGSACR
ncbi:MAG TPA: LysR family transcriptional regulator [Allosphingosinicella sp.]|nr:LysR family transcriptional regulator [Allosphingosinicella sp.]